MRGERVPLTLAAPRSACLGISMNQQPCRLDAAFVYLRFACKWTAAVHVCVWKKERVCVGVEREHRVAVCAWNGGPAAAAPPQGKSISCRQLGC